ncbi:MAG: transposase [Tannerella sp.]|nr:transposase [Tannerella sp.]
MIDTKPVNFSTVGYILNLRSKTVYQWYRKYLSGYTEALESGQWGKDNFVSHQGREPTLARVPVLKPENFGEEMSIDEKMLDEDFFTVMTNRNTGKLALFAQTMRVNELTGLIDKIPHVRDIPKNITCDLSPTYEKFCKTTFPNATLIADKFHIIRSALDTLQDVRIRLKQSYLSSLPKDKKERKSAEKKSRLINGETPCEMFSRSRYLLFKRPEEWTIKQQTRANILFENYPELEKAYHNILLFRKLLNKENVHRLHNMEKQWNHWFFEAEDSNISEIIAFAAMIERHEEKVKNYLLTGKTNAAAENMNSKLQRFITANYGTRDIDFCLFRIAKYFS